MPLGRCEPWREVPPADLERRPPEVIRGDDALATAAGDDGLHAHRLLADDQLAPKHRPKRLSLDVGTQAARDRLRRGVGLLGPDSTLLDREVRAVAGRVDILDADDACVVVDRDEAVLVARK